ncbi:MAG: NifB/NifX family molybdenum-iron cluster-binding protein [Desulfobacterales bacterium]
MKIAISSTGPTLDDPVDPRFGRCAYFVIVETDDLSFEAFNNESISLGGGAGIQSAQFVASKGVDAVITGNCGPKALQALSAAKIEIFVGQSGAVREVIEKYRKGVIKSTETPNVTDHYGMVSSANLDRWIKKRGGGGMGRGRGMGMGRGINGATWNVSCQSGPTLLSREEKLNRLKDQVNELRQQIEDLESSMKVLEKK